jgi:hypothetical protein
MNADERDLVLRLRSAGETVPVIVPPVNGPLQRGRERVSRHRLVLAVTVVVAASVLVGSILSLADLAGRPAPGATSPLRPPGVRLVAAPYSDHQIPIPPGWHFTVANSERVDYFAASTRQSQIAGLVRGCGPQEDSCSIHRLRGLELGTEDAFVDAELSYPPACLSCPTMVPIPSNLRLRDFHPTKDLRGSPIHEAGGIASGGGVMSVRYWIGANASTKTRRSTTHLLFHLGLPNGGSSASPSFTSCLQLIPGCRAKRLPDVVLRKGDHKGALGPVGDMSLGDILSFDEALRSAGEEDAWLDADTVQVTLGSADADHLGWGKGVRLFYVVDWSGICVPSFGGPMVGTPDTRPCVGTRWATVIDAQTGSFIVGGSTSR